MLECPTCNNTSFEDMRYLEAQTLSHHIISARHPDLLISTTGELHSVDEPDDSLRILCLKCGRIFPIKRNLRFYESPPRTPPQTDPEDLTLETHRECEQMEDPR